MSDLWAAIHVEALKARHSRMLVFTLIGITFVPFIGGFFMIVLKDPAGARELGIISTKAQIVGGEASWPSFLNLLAQAAALGGFIIFSFVASWLFGREYADRTVKDLLALPTPRSAIILAKFIVGAIWAALLIAVLVTLGWLVGWLVLGQPDSGVPLAGGLGTIVAAAFLTLALVTPVAFFAVAGQGFLPPMGFAITAMIAAQIVAAIGWGEYFPWSVPALYAGAAGTAAAQLGLVSFVLVAVTSLLGMAATFLWFGLADQTR